MISVIMQLTEFRVIAKSLDPLLIDYDGAVVNANDLVIEEHTEQDDQYIESRQEVIDAVPFG